MIGRLTIFSGIEFFLFAGFISNLWADDAVTAFQLCRKITVPVERLECFDESARKYAPPLIKGKLGHVTDLYNLDKPHLLRYRSHGVIFVLYLRDEEGNVLQNLHIGGRGEDEYLISEPGKYSLKIDGSAGWEIWLEPIE